MPRQPRNDIGNQIYHVINRANNRIQIFVEESDYEIFEQVLVEAYHRTKIRLLAYINMPNHVHLILYPYKDGELSKYMHWITTTFTQRWHAKHGTSGTGHLFQGRYKSIPVKDDKYLLQLLLYVERNALRAKLVNKAEEWRWSSLWIREWGRKTQKKILAAWPIEMPANYINIINQAENPDGIYQIRFSINNNLPLKKGSLRNRPQGRPPKRV